jgi:hypothetical protein
MQVGAFWLLIVLCGFMATGFGLAGNIALGETSRDLQVVADQALTNGEGPMLTALAAEQAAGQSYSVAPSPSTGACTQNETCTWFVQVSYSVRGSTNSGAASTNETAGDLQEQAKIDEQLVSVHEVATVTNAQGAVLAKRGRRIVVKVSNVGAQIGARFDDAAGTQTIWAGQAQVGCDGSSSAAYQSTCNADAAQAGSDTSSHAYLTCVDNPTMYAYCNGATPRPADQFAQPKWQDPNAATNGVDAP